MEIIIDGKILHVRKAVPLLQGLRDHGVSIPHLCFYPSLGGRGSCGLCVVEVYEDGFWKTEHSCLLYPREGLQIRTNTPRVRRLRAWAASLLLLRGPFRKKEVDEMLKAIVREGMGVGRTAVPLLREGSALDESAAGVAREKGGCILCGLCVMICGKVGKKFLTFLGRGKNLRIAFVSNKEKGNSCGNCRACRVVCPTGFIEPSARDVFKARLYK